MKKISLALAILVAIFMSACKDVFNGADILVSEDITSATTWKANKTYVVTTNIYVKGDLTIEPGTTIKFNENCGLYIGKYEYGSLVAEGTEKDPITFTSNSNSPSAGDWNEIEFGEHNSTSRSSLAYCTIKFGGQDDYGMLYIANTAIKMNHCTIESAKSIGVEITSDGYFTQCENNKIWNCGKHPISCDALGISTIGASNEILANTNFGILVTFSDLEGNHTWNKFSAPYIIQQNTYFESANTGTTLTIAPGTTLKFNADVSLIFGKYNYGKLIANGTSDAPITFTSAAPSPSKGDWNALEFGEKTMTGSVMNYCKVSYGSEADYALVYVDNTTNLSITNCNFTYSDNYGIYLVNSAITMSGNTFSNNDGADVYVQP